jgi:hypothetical protein
MTDHKLNIFANKRKMKIPGTEKKSIWLWVNVTKIILNSKIIE